MQISKIYVAVFLVSVFISSVSQIILKKSADIQYENRIKEYFNSRVICAYGLFFASSLLTILAYKRVPLSMGPILETTGYIWVSLLGLLVLKEKISKKKLLGLGVIILGIVVFNI